MQNWLIFDAMGVIFEVGDDTRDLLIPFIKNSNPELDEQRIFDLYIKASIGSISSKEFWQSLSFENWQEIERNYLDSSLTLDRAFIETTKQLSGRFNLAMLSNDVSEWSLFLRNKFNLDKLFKTVIISGDVGFRKPDKRIYEVLLKQINAPAKNCIFFDDRVKNLIPARELGIKSILFNRDKVDTEGFESIDGFQEVIGGI